MLKLKNSDFLCRPITEQKFGTSREHVAGAYSYKLKQKIHFLISMQNSGERIVVMSGCFNGWVFSWQKIPLEASCSNLIVVGWIFSWEFTLLFFHHIKWTLKNIKWNPKSNNSYGKINFFFWGERTYVTISSFLR